jgi:hypothetical protein
MSRYTKTPSAKYFKHLRCAYPSGSRTSTRNPAVFSDSSLNSYEFKSVLPHVLKDTVSGKGSNVKPSNSPSRPRFP